MKEESPRKQREIIEFLLPQMLGTIRVPWWSFFDQRGLLQHLLECPGISFRIKDENQYVIGGYWRGRPDVGLVMEVTGSKNRVELIERLVERFVAMDCGAVILASAEADRNVRWFLQQGWQLLDEIVIYTRRNCRLDGLPQPALPLQEFQNEQIEELLDLERLAFPYLWWSGRNDFLRYANMPDVKVFTLQLQGQMAGYFSFTLRNRQGYLDRIAVHPAFQRRGYGAQLLSAALERFDQLGARTVSLNTQVTNHRAQQLYLKYGFIRTTNVERIYGLWLKRQEDLESSQARLS